MFDHPVLYYIELKFWFISMDLTCVLIHLLLLLFFNLHALLFRYVQGLFINFPLYIFYEFIKTFYYSKQIRMVVFVLFSFFKFRICKLLITIFVIKTSLFSVQTE